MYINLSWIQTNQPTIFNAKMMDLNLAADFKGDRTVTAELQVSEPTDDSDFRYDRKGHVYLETCTSVVSFKTTA